jgi:hypothetical protein
VLSVPMRNALNRQTKNHNIISQRKCTKHGN